MREKTRLKLLGTLLLTTLLWAFCASAQPQVTRGGFVKKRVYQTYGTTVLYVDGDQGNDANSCADAGVFACATIQGAINKLPRFIQNTTTINVAAAADGGIKDYAGFVYASESVVTPSPVTGTGTAFSVTVQGSFIEAQGITGVTSGTITSYDAGGIRLDGGTSTDVSQFSTVTVAGAGWTNDQLKDKLFRLVRPDGGIVGTFAIYTNTSDTIVPSYQVTAASYAAATSIALVQPGTRINSVAPTAASYLLRHAGLGGLTVSRFDLIPKVTSPLGYLVGLSRPGSNILFSNVRFLHQGSYDTINIGTGQGVSFLGSYIKTSTSRYLVTSMTSPTSSLSISTSTIEGQGVGTYSVFVRGEKGVFSFTNNTIRDHLYSISTMGCEQEAYDVVSSRFIRTGSGIYVPCAGTGRRLQLLQYANYYEDIPNSAIWVQGPVYVTSPRASALQLGSEARNVAGYGMLLEYGAWGDYLVGGIYGNDPVGTLGEVAINDCLFGVTGCPAPVPYTSSFLSSLPQPRCVTLSALGTRVCL